MDDAMLAMLERKLQRLQQAGKGNRVNRIELKIAALKAGQPFVDPNEELVHECVDSFTDGFVSFNKGLILPIRNLLNDNTFMSGSCQGKCQHLFVLGTEEVSD